MPPLAVGAALTGASVLAGAFKGKQKTQTKTQTRPVFSADQQALQSGLGARLTDQLNNPASLDPLQTAAASGVNRSFDAAQTQLEQRLAARGFGNSGKLVTNTKDLAIKRAGAQGNLESQFAALKIDQGNRAIDQAQRFAFASPGSDSTSESTGTGGGGLAGAVGGGAETATLLYALNHFLNKPSGASVGELPGGIPAGFDEGGPLGTAGY